mgnify:CR=1 FL=1
MSELVRRYLQTRRSLGEPALELPDRNRAEVVRALRRLDRAVERGGAGDDVTDAGGGAGENAGGSPDLERLSREATAEEIEALPDLESLRRVSESCVRCPLHEERENVVFGEGSRTARVVCVGEAPGAEEDRTGRPFVGRAGKLLDRLLLSAGFRREEVFICNVLKCRPPGNRDPEPGEIDRCSPYLLRQIELIDPAVILAFGSFASRTLLDVRDSIRSMRQQAHEFRGYPLAVTYHPAALLRNPNWTRPTWEDLQKVRRMVDDTSHRKTGSPNG